MKKRPLCTICLMFLIIRSLLLFINGQPFVRLPVSSIFYEMEEEKEVLLEGTVYQKSNTEKNQVLYLKNNSITYQKKTFYESNILIYDNSFEEISIGAEIKVTGDARVFECARNPGNFDQQLYYARQNIYGYLFVGKFLEIVEPDSLFREHLYQFRQIWKNALLDALGEKNGATLSAILLSEKAAMDEEVKELYQKNGIGHVLAISGLHISFLGLGIYQWLRKGGIPYFISGMISVSILTIYVCMIGISVSVVRAYIMLLLRIGADITGRVYDMLTAVLLAAVILVWHQPLYLTDAAFYMSHGAILGILLISPALNSILPKQKWLLKGIDASLAINVALFPIMLWFYYEISTYSILLNLLVIPLMSGVLSFGMLGSLGYFIWKPLGKLMLLPGGAILWFYEKIGAVGIQMPFARIVIGKPEIWQILLYYLGLIVIIWRIKRRGEKKLWLLSGYFVLCILFTKLPDGNISVSIIDVGQGDSIYIRGPYGSDYLIDGGSSAIESVGKYRIEPFLKSQGVGSLEYVFVSHGDSDHYNGILEMMQRQLFGIHIKKLILPSNYKNDEKLMELMYVAAENKIPVSVMEAGQKIVEGKLQIQCLQPGMEMENMEGNAGSLVLDITFQKFEMLCTGDVENEGETLLNENLRGKAYDVLKVAHHGSKNSTSEEFLEIVKPKLALISAGVNNYYGHPHEETLNRLRNIKCKILQTNEQGMIRIESNGDSIDIFSGSI